MSLTSDLQNLYASLSLEIAAVSRYLEHQTQTQDPAILALLQGLMRNEDGHEEELIKQIKRCNGDADMGTKLPDPKMPKMIYEGTQVEGQKTNLALLRADLAFEEEAVKKYTAFSSRAKDEEISSIFLELARAERGHVNGLRTLIKAVEEGKHEVAFFCPICGWSVPFGAAPEIGKESRCKMCGMNFELAESNGDFKLRRK